MKEYLVKISAVCLAGTMIFATTQFNSNASSLSIEKPIAGISLTLDSYYSGILMDNHSMLRTASLPEESELPAATKGELFIDDEADKAPVSEELEATDEDQKLKDLQAEYKNMGISTVDNYLNIREKPGEDQKIIGKLPKNAGCTIYDIDKDGWAKIKSGKITGYVLSTYLTMGEEAAELAMKVGTKTAKVNTTTLKLREKADIDSACITLIPIGEEYEVLKVTDEWVRVEVDNDKGWVSKEFVDLSYQLKKAVSNEELATDGSSGVSSTRASMVAYAKQFLGNRYVWGGTSLTNGTDCSGFTMSIYSHFGIGINRTSGAQSTNGTRISYTEAKPGDLIFYSNGSRINHVAMYIGNGQVIHASNPRSGIKISNMTYRTPVAATRILN